MNKGDIFAFDFKDPSALDKVEDFLNSNNNEPNEQHHNEHKSPSRKLDKTITQFDKPNVIELIIVIILIIIINTIIITYLL